MKMRFVYFMQAEEGGKIKIGRSDDPERRAKMVSYWSPVPIRLLAYAEGEPRQETTLHAYFAESWSHGEWFHETPELAALITFVKENKKIPAAYLPFRATTRAELPQYRLTNVVAA